MNEEKIWPLPTLLDNVKRGLKTFLIKGYRNWCRSHLTSPSELSIFDMPLPKHLINTSLCYFRYIQITLSPKSMHLVYFIL